jgi:hypothetical protein
MRTFKNLLAIAFAGILAFGMVACTVEQTEEGNLPEYEVEQTEEGNLPEYDVDAADVDIEMETREIQVPDIDVTPADEDEDDDVPDDEPPS